MVVATEISSDGPYLADGVATVFDRRFVILEADHLKVTLIEDGIATPVLSGYSQTGVGGATGTVVFDTPPPAGSEIYLSRSVPALQESDYSAQGGVSPEIFERDLDLLVMRQQDQQRDLDRIPKAPIGSDMFSYEDLNASVASAQSAADQAVSSATASSTSATAAAASQAAAASSETAAADSATAANASASAAAASASDAASVVDESISAAIEPLSVRLGDNFVSDDPSSWDAFNTADPTSSPDVPAIAPAGATSIEFFGINDSIPFVQGDINGRTFVFRAWVNSSGRYRLYTRGTSASTGGSVITQFFDGVDATDGWERITVEFTGKVSVTQWNFRLFAEGGAFLLYDPTLFEKDTLSETSISLEQDYLTSAETEQAIDASVDAAAAGRPLRLDPALGNGTTDAAAALQALVAGGDVEAYIPAGRYRIGSAVRLQQNTKIVLAPDAVILNDNTGGPALINGVLGNTTYASGFTGDGNIHISGGTFSNELKRARQENGPAIAFAHGFNISFTNVIFEQNYQAHFIDLCACKKVRFYNCHFNETELTSPGTREAIGIDYAFSGGFSYFGSFDGTVCDDVLVEGCLFQSVDVAVGAHSDPLLNGGVRATHRRVRVVNCMVENVVSAGVDTRYLDTKDSEIVGTIVRGTPTFGAVRGPAKVDGVFQINVGSNEVVELFAPKPVDPSGSWQGFVTVMAHSASANAPKVGLWCRFNGTSTPIVLFSDPAMDTNLVKFSTAPLVAGQGNVDEVEIAASSDGKLYIRNNRGSDMDFFVTFDGSMH